MSPLTESNKSLLAAVGLLLVAAASASARHLTGPKCPLLDHEPPSKRQVITFGNASKLTFDGSLRISTPGEDDKFLALEGGYSTGSSRRSGGSITVGVHFECAQVWLQSYEYVNFGYGTRNGWDAFITFCSTSDPLFLGPDGSYASPDGAPMDFKCRNVDYGLASGLAVRYIKIEDNDQA